MRPHHGSTALLRSMHAPHSRYFASGKFGRLFPNLPPLFHRNRTNEELQQALRDLGQPGGPLDPSGAAPVEIALPAGFAFLGQFIDHDITLDTTSSFERQNDPEGIANFRTPALELDSVYGAGPHVHPYLYQPGTAKLLIEAAHGRDQIPRNSVGTALIGDPRNDENLIISQIHLAFLKFHNALVDALAAQGVSPAHLFDEAQRIARWHFQWVVLHDFLPRIIGQAMVDDIYDACGGSGRSFYHWRHEPFIPVEFAVAAYRFGHSLIPATMSVNPTFTVAGSEQIPLFDRNEIGDSDPDDLSGFGLRAPRRYVEWDRFFETGGTAPQSCNGLDRFLAKPLFDLPFIEAGPLASLATRNLERGHAFGLPSGQSVACAMCVEPLSPADLSEVQGTGFELATPLWYYILKEAEVCESSIRLGAVGGRIVGEVLIGLLEGDRKSFVRANPKWTPSDEDLGTDDDFGMAQLVTYAA